MVKSVCPYCAVGCGQDVYVRDHKVTQIEAAPDSPVSRGHLCPKGSASLQRTTGQGRRYQVLYRRPSARNGSRLDLDPAMDMIADRVIEARRQGWQWEADGRRTRRTLGFASLGGATLNRRRELPDQEAVHGPGRHPDRESGPYMTLVHSSRSGI